MTTRVEPNPYSPYADANPNLRHAFPVPDFFPALKAGALLPAGCGGMAVVPTEPLQVVPAADLPEGLCPACVEELRGNHTPPSIPPAECRECGTDTRHADLCALCRQEKHDKWWAVRNAE